MLPELARSTARQQTQYRSVGRQLVAPAKVRPVRGGIHVLDEGVADEAARHAVAPEERRLERQQRQQMIDGVRQARGTRLAPRPRLRRLILHAHQRSTGKAPLQA